MGELIRHPLGRTVTATDNTWFTLLTVNSNPIHFDRHYSAQTEFGKPLMNSTFTLALVTGLSVADVSAECRQPRLGRSAHARAGIRRRHHLRADRSAEQARIEIASEHGTGEIKTTGFKQDGTVVMEFRRTILVYKRGHAPQVPSPIVKQV